MDILGIVASPRKSGNTEVLVNEALKEAANLGAETQLWTATGKKIEGCTSCFACIPSGECIIDDDMNELYPLLKQADGIIFGSPVYFWNVTAQAKAIIDRTFNLWITKSLKGKVGGAIACTWTRGTTPALQAINTFFSIQGMYTGGGFDVTVSGYCETVAPGTLMTTGLEADGKTPHNDPWAQARECAREMVNLINKLKGH